MHSLPASNLSTARNIVQWNAATARSTVGRSWVNITVNSGFSGIFIVSIWYVPTFIFSLHIVDFERALAFKLMLCSAKRLNPISITLHPITSHAMSIVTSLLAAKTAAINRATFASRLALITWGFFIFGEPLGMGV